MNTPAVPSRQILVVNCGSSSIKFVLMNWPDGAVVASGLADRLGTESATLTVKFGSDETATLLKHPDHEHALREVLDQLEASFGDALRICAVGHRVVHGGEFFRSAVRVDTDVIEKIDACSKLAPLHNPAHVLGIRTAMECFPEVPQVVVFDTAFHQTIPPKAFLYAIPYEHYENLALRRYGMHGTSHHYVGMQAAARLGKPFEAVSLITAHLGNGCSVCAIRNGRSVDTSMGLTPLEGVMMGTRSGDVDPNLHLFLMENAGMSLEETTVMLNRKSGLLGVSGVSNDMRAVAAAADSGNARAALAIDLFSYRLAKGILAQAAGLDQLDALVFTGGIGENSSLIRGKTCKHLRLLGVEIDAAINAQSDRSYNGRISPDSTSGPRVLVIPTNEEWMIAQSTAEVLAASNPRFFE